MGASGSKNKNKKNENNENKKEENEIKQSNEDGQLLENERKEKEQLKKQLEQEKLEKEKLKEQLEQERIEKEQLKEQLEQEKYEIEQLKQKLEQEKIELQEKERIEKERIEKERIEQERIEQEKIEQERIEQERIEQGRIEKEKLEKEKLEKERIEKEQKEKEQKEQELKALQEKEKANIPLNNQTGNEVKSLNNSIPKDRELYLDIPLKTKKNKILIPSLEDLARFRLDTLKRHNYYRKYHQVGPMELTDTLNNFAQKHAETLATRDKAGFSSDEDRIEFCGESTGENISHLYKTNDNFDINGAKLVDFWYENIKNYDFKKSDAIGDKMIANFTQVVHKASTKLGVGLAKNIKSGDVYLVANYQKKGNNLSTFKYSVFPVLLDEKMKQQIKIDLEEEKEIKRKREEELFKKAREQEEEKRKEREKEELKNMEKNELDKKEQEENEIFLKEIINDEKTGKELKSFNSKFPPDKCHYLSIVLKTAKDTVYIPTQENLERFRRDGLKRHNYYRKYHQAGPLILTQKLNDFAQNYAETLAKKNMMMHSEEEDRDKIYGGWAGENIFTYWTSGSNLKITGADAVDRWYDEIKDYDFRTCDTKNGRPVGHFTQLIWKGTNKVGLGVARNKDNNVYVVANYYLSGNIEGYYKKNVLPMKIIK